MAKNEKEFDEFDEKTHEETNFNEPDANTAYRTADELGVKEIEEEEAVETKVEDIAPVSKAPEAPDAGIGDSFDDIDIESFEAQVNNIKSEDIDDFSDKMDYESFIVISKRDALAFCAVVEPLAKTAVDDYGKSVYIRSISTDVVELNYLNEPSRVVMSVANKSGKKIRDFAILVTTLKKLVSNAYSSLVFVAEGEEINIALCDSLMYLETKPLLFDDYNFEKKDTKDFMDKELASYTFKRVGAMLNASDRASEKVVVIKNNFANFNTGFFAAKSKSPFVKSEDFVIYKMVTDVINVLAVLSKVDLRFSTHENLLVLSCDGSIYCELPVATGEKVSDFYSPVSENALKFETPISIVQDSLLRLIQVTNSLDYLSEIITLNLEKKKLELIIHSTNQSKLSKYSFDILEGEPERIGEMKLSCKVLISFFGITGTNIKYAFTEEGLGIKNENGVFLLRRSQ